MDMWAAYAQLVRQHAVNAQILFDRFHIVKHLNETVDAARRDLWASTHHQTESQLQRHPLAAAEESVESEQRPKGTAFDARALEFAASPRLVLDRILPTLLDLQTAVAGQAASAQVDELGHAIEVGTIPEIRRHAPLPLGRSPRLDQNPAFKRSRGGHE
jgi:hypothetical protein